jgi:TPR repeat protein
MMTNREMLQISILHSTTWNPCINLEVALQYSELSIRNDIPRGLYRLREMYNNGYAGLRCDPFKALELWRKAAQPKQFTAAATVDQGSNEADWCDTCPPEAASVRRRKRSNRS